MIFIYNEKKNERKHNENVPFRVKNGKFTVT